MSNRGVIPFKKGDEVSVNLIGTLEGETDSHIELLVCLTGNELTTIHIPKDLLTPLLSRRFGVSPHGAESFSFPPRKVAQSQPVHHEAFLKTKRGENRNEKRNTSFYDAAVIHSNRMRQDSERI